MIPIDLRKEYEEMTFTRKEMVPIGYLSLILDKLQEGEYEYERCTMPVPSFVINTIDAIIVFLETEGFNYDDRKRENFKI